MHRQRQIVLWTAWLLSLAIVMCARAADASEDKVNTLRAMFARLKSCWISPVTLPTEPGLQITVLVSFKRDGNIFGKPKITYESEYATDQDRLIYRTAIAEALQRCTPMPFTEEFGNAVAGRPLRIKFDDRRTKSTEMKSWQTTKIL
jgi:hypothetical protein